jgi:hypothetical protein
MSAADRSRTASTTHRRPRSRNDQGPLAGLLLPNRDLVPQGIRLRDVLISRLQREDRPRRRFPSVRTSAWRGGEPALGVA